LLLNRVTRCSCHSCRQTELSHRVRKQHVRRVWERILIASAAKPRSMLLKSTMQVCIAIYVRVWTTCCCREPGYEAQDCLLPRVPKSWRQRQCKPTSGQPSARSPSPSWSRRLSLRDLTPLGHHALQRRGLSWSLLFCAPNDELLPTGSSSLIALSFIEAVPLPLGALERRPARDLCVIPWMKEMRHVVVSNHPPPRQTSRTTIDTPPMPSAFTRTLSHVKVSCTSQSCASPTCTAPIVHRPRGCDLP
jgi:hypothetical protein